MSVQFNAAIVQTPNGVQIRPFLDTEVEVTKKYTAPGFRNQFKRGWEALTTQDSRPQRRLREHIETGRGIGGTLGAIAGTTVALSRAIPTELFTLAAFGPAAVPAAFALKVSFGLGSGFVAGNLAGGAVGATYSVITLSHSNEYLQWKGEAIVRKVFPVWQNFLNEYVDDFICPISQDLIGIPVRAPDGRTYEKAAIERWINQKELAAEGLEEPERTNILINTSVIRACIITKESLVYADDYHKKLFERLATVYNDGVAAVLGPNIASPNRALVMEAIQVYAQNVLPQNNQIITQAYNQCLEELEAGRMTQDEYVQKTAEINQRMQVVPLPIFIG
jgi:hypothetical protein